MPTLTNARSCTDYEAGCRCEICLARDIERGIELDQTLARDLEIGLELGRTAEFTLPEVEAPTSAPISTPEPAIIRCDYCRAAVESSTDLEATPLYDHDTDQMLCEDCRDVIEPCSDCNVNLLAISNFIPVITDSNGTEEIVCPDCATDH